MSGSKPGKIIVYGSSVCPMVPAVRSTLRRADAEYEYINITFDALARQQVVEINNGYASVPTLVFPDGSTLTEPSSRELEAKLRSVGLEVGDVTFLDRIQDFAESPFVRMFGIVFVAIGIINNTPILLMAGLVLLVLGLLTHYLRSATRSSR
ncbi:MAG: glutaredoxin domain-containing protein [Chloroflexota bacterium]|nr:glutaredoxin domain-containing protein [Chloroflexota bacterium]